MRPRTRSGHPTRRKLLAVLAVVTLAAAGVAGYIAVRAVETGDETTPLSFRVDSDLTPGRSTVPGLRQDDPPRPVGQVADPDGIAMDVVLDEIVIAYKSDTDLNRLVESIGGKVVDRFEDEGEPVRDALVGFPRYEVADQADVAAAMSELEGDLGGEWKVSEPAVLPVLDMLGRAADAGVTAMPNALHKSTGFGDGSTTDGGDPNKDESDAFTWSYVTSGTAQDIGLDFAWRLLADTGAFKKKDPGWANRIKIMVVDQGFQLNNDVPDYHEIRRADWGESGWGDGSWHGAAVVNALMGKVDNRFGGAGPAGPIDPGLIAVGDAGGSWSNVRSLVKLVKEYRPNVINMSYSSGVTAARLAYQGFYERKFSKIKHDYGALPIASAGNDGRNIDAKKPGAAVERVLVLPCEAKHVVCVGGMGEDTTERAVGDCGDEKGSNYGARTGGRSVEIWGPYFVNGWAGKESRLGSFCGTSFASPFVGGVAALVKAADPSLGPDGIWNVLKATAHNGGIGAEATGHQRRINARDAVLRAYGKAAGQPKVSITSPQPGTKVYVDQTVDLTADTRDHRGRTGLPVTWTSNKDGKIAGASKADNFVESLSAGTHTVTATATDRLGQTGSDTVVIRVAARPITVTIASPSDGKEIPATGAVMLAGNATDDTRPLNLIGSSRLHWSVTRASGDQTALFQGVGRTLGVPEGTLQPGSYRAELAVTIGSQTTTAATSFVIVEPDPNAPTARIIAPAHQKLITTGDENVQLRLHGTAVASNGDALPGTRMRWIARRAGEERVLCAGSNTPQTSGGGGIAATTSCDDVEVTLKVPIGSTAWAITLQAYASPSLTGTDEHGITTHYTPPPVP